MTSPSSRSIRVTELRSSIANSRSHRIAAEIRAANLGDGDLGASFGIASGAGPNEAALLEAADRALLEAKDRLYAGPDLALQQRLRSPRGTKRHLRTEESSTSLGFQAMQRFEASEEGPAGKDGATAAALPSA